MRSVQRKFPAIWLIILGIGVQNINAQTLEWVKSVGGRSEDRIRGLVVDDSGCVYVTGSFGDTFDFDPGPGIQEAASAGRTDVFFAKFDPVGNLVWVHYFGHALSDGGTDIKLDSHGNIYICGTVSDTVDFDSGPDTAMVLSNGGYDAFIAKFDPDGNYLWAHCIGGKKEDSAWRMDLDAQGNLYVVGAFMDSVDFNPGPDTSWLYTTGIYNFYLAKYTPEGELIWAIPGGSNSRDFALDLKLDRQDNVYLCGKFDGTADFDPSPDSAIVASTGFDDIFIAKYGQDGSLEWANSMGGNQYDLGVEIEVNRDNSLYVVGAFESVCDFDPSPDSFYLHSVGSTDIFIAQYGHDGKFHWAIGIGGEGFDRASRCVLDSAGNLWVAGEFSGTVDFDPGPYSTILQGGDRNIFLTKHGPQGNLRSALQVECKYYDGVHSINLDKHGDILLGGSISKKVDFDPGPDTAYVYAHRNDLFLAKYSRLGNTVPEYHLTPGMSAFPNPTTGMVNIDLGSIMSIVVVLIYNELGQKLGESKFEHAHAVSIDIPHLPGVYLLEIMAEGEASTFLKVVRW